jgi:mannosyl-3-phosphoglycerate phosphatase
MTQMIIFTDLDGTLLDHETYSFDAALPALHAIRERGIPLIICSSKTKKEIEHYRKRLENHHPFITENGGGVFIPKGYFEPASFSRQFAVEEKGEYDILRLGAGYADLRDAIVSLRKAGFEVRGFGDMTAQDIAEIAKLSPDEARMAKERDFDEPFLFEGNDEKRGLLFEAIIAKGFRYTKGRFFHILGSSDKGKAVDILSGLYRKKFGSITTIALGDSPNDLPMLEQADCPVIVRKPDGGYDAQLNLPNIVRAEGIGPDGWNKALLRLLT